MNFPFFEDSDLYFEQKLLRESKAASVTAFVAALGYFVDVFDIVLFQMVRVSSLASLGLGREEILQVGVQLFNTQLTGMLLGGIIWGVIGDKFGRLKVLFGSIFLYSIGNLANAFVTSVDAYMLCRFISGLGLAGEVGAAVTLVSEMMPRHRRGISTSLVAAAGTGGAFAASIVSQYLSWKHAYLIGGSLGLVLLTLRLRVHESGMFLTIEATPGIARGNISFILKSTSRWKRYLTCILSGLPLLFTLYVLITFAPEVGHGLRIRGDLVTAKASFYFTAAMIIGDVCCGLLSQRIRSRKRAMAYFIGGAFIFSAVLTSMYDATAETFYLFCVPTGFFSGYWAVYVAAVAEQFGTNLRSTVATSTLNLVRATPIGMIFIFVALRNAVGVVLSMQIVGLAAFALSFFFLSRLKETFNDDLAFIEQ